MIAPARDWPRTVPANLPRRLQRTVHQAFAGVPAYRELWRDCGIEPQSLRLPAELGRLPVIGKRDLLRFPLGARCRRHPLAAGMRIERTSGSTGQPFEIPLSASQRRRRQLRFLRALMQCGYRPGLRLLLLAARTTGPLARLLNWRRVPLTLDEARLADAYREWRPAVLYGPLNTLLALARALREGGTRWPRPRAVISTAEALDARARQQLQATFGVAPADFFGLSETGLLAWRAAHWSRYRVAAGEFLLECLPEDGEPALERLVVTDLCDSLMPLVRFDTGDLVRREHRGADAGIAAFAGRRVDSLVLPDGRRISPYRVTLALEAIGSVQRFRVLQQADLSLQVQVWSDRDAAARTQRHVAACLRSLTAGALPVTACAGGDPGPARKFRPVQSMAGRAP